ncbi:hypothetical protein KI387_043042, partial [Taxus chinensis]
CQREFTPPPLPPQVKIESANDITKEAVKIALIRAIQFYANIQAHDEHCPGDYGGPMFLMP